MRGRKPKKTKERPRAAAPTVARTLIRTQWKNLHPMFDFWGVEMKRHYSLETLSNAVDRLVHTRDRFIIRSVQQVLGPPPVTSLAFELFQEGKYQLVFRLRATNAKGNQATFGFIAAKNAEDFTEVARLEHGNLKRIHERAPKFVVEPLLGGMVFLPDRHRRETHHREVYAYLTRWIGGFHELGVARNLQYFLNVAPPQYLTLAQTQEAKRACVEIVACTYSAKDRNGTAMPQISSGDFVIARPSNGPLKLRLIACRKLLDKVPPARYLHEIIKTKWAWGDKTARLAPDDPRDFAAAIRAARGDAEGALWLAEYVAAVESKKLPDAGYLSRKDAGLPAAPRKTPPRAG